MNKINPNLKMKPKLNL